MGSKTIYQTTLLFIRLAFILLFVYTATNKLMYLSVFQERLERFPFIAPFNGIISVFIPFIELVIAGLFLFPKYILPALYSSFILLMVFTVYIASVMKFSGSIPCSCGGVLSYMGWTDHILFNAGFMSLAGLGMIMNKKLSKKVMDQNTT
ncbi:MauE/DoxX family redox-associated membrane protein [Flagellimonas sp.]|uniref:MauE/DoxX family redox-associated membrane protein n=1 Tax=Flagellimonas sp. TaxID=2058762 RepID=UPI003AB62375